MLRAGEAPPGATVTFLPRGKAGASADRTTKILALVTKLTGARCPLLR